MTSNDTRSMGSDGLEAAPLGLGCMGMSEFYGTADEGEAVRTIHRALELGVTLLDTADMYGPFTNEKLVGRAVREWGGERPLIATKFGNVRGENGEFLGIRGDAGYVRNACEASLKRLGLDTIDLYYQHRVDPEVPIEETVGAMAELVQEGKVRHLGLSEAGAETIRRAVAVHPISALQTEYSLWERSVEEEILPTIRELGIGFVAYSPLGRGFLTGKIRHAGISEAAPDTIRRANAVQPVAAVQTEYSLWTRDPEDDGVLATCAELGIGFVAYSPIGRGFLSGQIRSIDDLAPDDFRRRNPRFQGEAFEQNLRLVDRVREIADEKGVTATQLALAWVMAQGERPGNPTIVPIPGTKRVAYLEENAAAVGIELTEDELRRIDAAAPVGAAEGDRYPDMSSVHR